MKCSRYRKGATLRFSLTFLSSSLLIFLLASSLAGAYSGGTGTPDDPYQIDTAQDLIDLGKTEDDYFKSFVLIADIDLAGWVFERAVIAPDMTRDPYAHHDGMPFRGRFDGQGHVIRNLYINDPLGCFQGLFGAIRGSAEIVNLGLEGVHVRGRTHVGGLVGDNSGKRISLSYSTGLVSGVSTVGGLAGSNGGSISASHSTCTVHGSGTVGGLAGNNGGSISSSHSTCTVYGTDSVGGLVGHNGGPISSSSSAGSVYGNDSVGGLVGRTFGSKPISSSHSSASVHGTEEVGGLVGVIARSGIITSCNSTGAVSGRRMVGGLVGLVIRSATISLSYSTGRVSGAKEAGGLVGRLLYSDTIVSSSFWDIESSEQTRSAGGVDLTSEQMQAGSTYVQAGWDLTHHPVNNPDPVWWIAEPGTPRLWWQYGYAHSPSPINHASTHMRELTLQWRPGGPGMQHDVYFGDDEDRVANPGPASQGVFWGRLPADTLSYDLYGLEPGQTYFWRIDGVNDLDPAKVWQGPVWSFTITGFVTVKVLDNFESYDDHCNRIFFIWQDGWGHSGGQDVIDCDAAAYDGNGSGAIVGNVDPPYASQVVIHSGSQCLPIHYANENWPWFSETQRIWRSAQDWKTQEADALTLYFQGEAENTQDHLYIAVEDNRGRTAVVEHSSERAVLATEWQVWHIPLVDLDALGVDVSAIKKLVIGVGHRDNPQPASSGTLYVDGIQLTKRVL
jgi:hypothetical protein